MATNYPRITDEQAALIKNAPVFFVASADPEMKKGPKGIGSVNLSPKGGVPLHILSPNRVAYLDYVGSGNETARHALAGGPVTIMVCSFEEENAGVIRLYGKASVTPLEDSPIADLLLEQPAEDINLPTRQVVEVEVESTITSCGYGVPVMSFVKDRTLSERGRRYKDGKPPSKA
ncbi:MAG: pyridoxamine 5'-phosphate oxidase family protein [Chloroflexi bacterium]|nr:pyridoxamine 5'-phosphate oxidase family protein [Chloroflexota bacterium]